MHTLAHAARTYAWAGDYTAAGALVDELAALAEEKGARAWKAFSLMHRGSLLVAAGEHARATQTIASGLEAWASTGSTLWMPCYLENLAKALAGLGQFDDAWARIGEAIAAVAAAEVWRKRRRDVEFMAMGSFRVNGFENAAGNLPGEHPRSFRLEMHVGWQLNLGQMRQCESI